MFNAQCFSEISNVFMFVPFWSVLMFSSFWASVSLTEDSCCCELCTDVANSPTWQQAKTNTLLQNLSHLHTAWHTVQVKCLSTASYWKGFYYYLLVFTTQDNTKEHYERTWNIIMWKTKKCNWNILYSLDSSEYPPFALQPVWLHKVINWNVAGASWSLIISCLHSLCTSDLLLVLWSIKF